MPPHAQPEPFDKVVFVGSFGVGKTVALEQLSDTPVVNTDVLSREAANENFEDKTTTTVGFDYGEWSVADGRKVQLFGLPSQERFKVMWGIILPSSSAIVLWAYGDRPDGLAGCRYWLEQLKQHNAINRICVAVTRIPANDPVLNSYRELVAEYHPLVPVITADPRRRDSVIQAVMVALSTPHRSE